MNKKHNISILLTFLALFVSSATAKGQNNSQDVNVYLPELQEVRSFYAAEKAELEKERTEKLTGLLQEFVSKAEEMYNAMRKRGNIRGVAIAGKAKRLFEAAIEEYKEKKSFKIEDQNREAIQKMIEACRTEKESINSYHKEKISSLESRAMEKFKSALDKLDLSLSESQIDSKFAELLASSGEKNSQPGSGPAGDTKEKPDGNVIAKTAEASAWYSVIDYQIESHGMDVIPLPVFKAKGSFDGKHSTPLLNKPSTWKMEVAHKLPRRPDYEFRVVRKSKIKPFDVVEWPRKRNNWKLIVRTAHPDEGPSSIHGATLQAALPGSEMKDILSYEAVAETGSKGKEKAAVPTIEIPVVTKPQGAVIYIDGRPWRKDGKIETTPCKVDMTEGTHAIRLSLEGYLDKTVRNYEAKEGAQIYWPFQKDPNIVMRKFRVSAGATTSTRIKVKKGSRIRVEAQGKWRCGSRGEMVGPEGYENNQKFYRYYLPGSNARKILKDANYGALLAKIGKNGKPVATGKKTEFTARSEGILYFEPNEPNEGDARKDNSGTLTVRVMIHLKPQ